MSEEQHTILVVDDDESNRDMLVRRLARKGYRMLAVASGTAALETVEREPVDLVLLDVMMPGLDGIDVLKEIRKTRSPTELPIIMVTARANDSDVIQALELGANDYVTKPIEFSIMAARIVAQLRMRRRAEPPAQPAPATAPAATPAPTPARRGSVGPGTVLAARYRIDSCIGSGNFGTVYRARHLTLDHDVAVKVLRGQMAGDDDAVARFQREAISTCRVQHPNAVLVTDFGVDLDVAFLVMELLKGYPLSVELARSGRLSVPRALQVVLPVCSVLAAAHDAGIIHRDVKPANVFLHEAPHGQVVKLLDFGLAKLTGNPALTMAGLILGTPAYMAPERFVEDTYGSRSDVYSVGTMLYQMLAGRLPFDVEGDDPMALAARKLREDPPPLGDGVPGLTPELAVMVMRALSRKADDRPSAGELGRGLAEAVGLQGASWETAALRLTAGEAAGPPAEVAEDAPTEVLPAFDERPKPDSGD
jgi:DNA-binding response OmpR family regulator